MPRVKYEVTLIIESDDELEKRKEIMRNIYNALDGFPGVRAVGVIDVERADKEAALFLSANKKLESDEEWTDEEFDMMMALDCFTEEARNNRVRDLYNKCAASGKSATALKIAQKYNI